MRVSESQCLRANSTLTLVLLSGLTSKAHGAYVVIMDPDGTIGCYQREWPTGCLYRHDGCSGWLMLSLACWRYDMDMTVLLNVQNELQ